MRYYRAELLAGSLLVLLALPCVAAGLLPPSSPPVRHEPPAVLDLNRTGVLELEALPGVGPKTAALILRGRPYVARDELVAVIGTRALTRIRSFVSARPASTSAVGSGDGPRPRGR